MVEQQVVHLPERALRGRRLGRLGGELRVRVHVVERQVPPHVADVAEVGQQLADDRLGLPAVGALEVAVLDHGDRRVLGPADVVALRVDRHGEVDDRLARCRAARGSAAAWAAARSTRNTSQVSADAAQRGATGCRPWPLRARCR